MALPPLLRPTTTRAVHLRITPRPSHLGESREILRLLSQFGEIEYFKNLKYDPLSAPNTTIVIFRDEEAAKHCLKRSPIRFRMGKAPPSSSSSSPVAGVNEIPAKGGFSELGFGIFQIQANTARAHFRDILNSSHFHGAFAVDGKAAAQRDLSKRVPMLGLSDVGWHAEVKPWRLVERERERDGAFKGSGRRRSLGEEFGEGV
ncbi:hypothetical protein LTR91_013025 [Friedmanniomyces endolithicus]|uniref:RRM domain-containing protein n=1 Tax=Friedmanniomyces endolithicus TaxID=329885 RepID=A0AAN6KEJ9_9PEZI|nr:hypothetical protein LTR94_000642 [Friedmanniomyces endolithicus]KAK0790824.1 hypothetical protein LTR59_009134 [Friedmanniomyces endolithicus]KAK0798509.1 hypothetical protein LTR38_007816 [Friedmanniomyces endolithicus]KAK0803726.1 hypothetical protein LTR75_007883 [Friedmanniomyces endolithicus]KAK0847006.1 hypothetical protein LTS02_014658 [Friedmanniomyces endolithicus]